MCLSRRAVLLAGSDVDPGIRVVGSSGSLTFYRMRRQRGGPGRDCHETSLPDAVSRFRAVANRVSHVPAGAARGVLARGAGRRVSVTNGAIGAGIAMCAAIRISGEQDRARSPGATILRSVEPGSALRGIRRGDAGGIRGMRRGRVVRTRPDRKPSRQDHPESRSSRAAAPRGVDQAGTNLGRTPSVAVGIVRSRGGPGPASAGMSLARRSRR